RLLLPASGPERDRHRLHADQRDRQHQRRLPVRALAVRDGLGSCRALHPSGEPRVRPARRTRSAAGPPPGDRVMNITLTLFLFVVAEPMRNTGKFTMADTLAYRMRAVPVRSAAAVATIAVSAGYMMAQMVGAGSLVKILIPTLDATLKPYFAWSTSLGFKLDP